MVDFPASHVRVSGGGVIFASTEVNSHQSWLPWKGSMLESVGGYRFYVLLGKLLQSRDN